MSRPNVGSSTVIPGRDGSYGNNKTQSDAERWVLSVASGGFGRVEVWAGASASARHLRQIASISIEGETDPSALFEKIDGCAIGSGQAFARASAFLAGERLPSTMQIWPVPPPPAIDDPDEADVKNLPAAYAGLLRQTYAHNEHLMGVVISQGNALLMHLQEENKALRLERAEMRERMQEAERSAGERESRMLEAQLKAGRDAALIRAGETLVKAAATHLALPDGASATGQPHPSVKAFADFIATLSPDQLTSVAAGLSIEQMALFNAAMETARDGAKES